MMKHLGLVRHFALLAIFLAVGDLHGADKIRVSGGGTTPLHSIIWVANQEGLFKKYGMDAEFLVIAQLARTNPKAQGQTVESLRVMEPSILDELKKSGFIDKVRK